jgi:outer membrane receptor protein involved in Fe transport
MKIFARLGAGVLLQISAQAFALEADGDDSGRVLEEIIVTATKRDVALQDLPMSVGVLTGQQLKDIGAIGLEDYYRLIPSLHAHDAPFGGNSVIIRGLADSDNFQSTEALSAFYIDDTSINYVSSLFANPGSASLVDVERVEVLRGPQGTLVGANAMGGAVRVITAEPDIRGALYKGELNLSSTAHGDLNYGGQFIVNQPTSENSALRVAAFYQSDGGFIDDIGLQRKDVNDRERLGGRLSWLWNVSDNFEALVRIYSEHINTGGYNYTDPVGKLEIGLATQGDYQVALLSPEEREEELSITSLRLRWTLGWGEIYSATSWYEKDTRSTLDWSKELFYDFFGFWHVAPFATDSRQRDITQEFRISSDSDGSLGWLAGFYYLDQEADLGAVGVLPGILEVCPPCGFLVPPDEVILRVNDVQTRQDTAFFGEINWRFTDELEATVGGRWYHIERSLKTGGSFGPFPLAGYSEGSASDFVPKVSLSWDVSEQTMLYGLVSKGFRPGQFNDGLSVQLCDARSVIDSDELVNYEAGVKFRTADQRFNMNATLFHIDWDDMQTSITKPGCPSTFLENAGKASSDGVEVELNWLVTERFSLQGSFGYNKAELAEAIPRVDIDAPAGTRIPNTPEWTASLAGTWNFRWNENVPGYVRADAQYVGSRTVHFDQSPQNLTLTSLDAYTLVNLRAGGDLGHWRTELFVTNLFDEVADIYCCRFDIDTSISRPRTVGVRTMFQFD